MMDVKNSVTITILTIMILLVFGMGSAGAVCDDIVGASFTEQLNIPKAQLPTTFTGDLEEDEVDVWTIDLKKDQKLTTEVSDFDTDVDLYVIEQSSCNIKCSSETTSDTETCEITASEAGTYSIQVYNLALLGFSTDYSLWVNTTGGEGPTPTPTEAPTDINEPNDYFSEATQIEGADYHIDDLYLTSSDSDYYEFDISEQSAITIETFSTANLNVETCLELFREESSVTRQCSNLDSGFSMIHNTQSPGTYQILVESEGDDAGYYGLDLTTSPTDTTDTTTNVTEDDFEPNDNTDNAKHLTLGSEYQVTLVGNDEDYYSFTIDNPGTYTITTYSTSTPQADTKITILHGTQPSDSNSGEGDFARLSQTYTEEVTATNEKVNFKVSNEGDSDGYYGIKVEYSTEEDGGIVNGGDGGFQFDPWSWAQQHVLGPIGGVVDTIIGGIGGIANTVITSIQKVVGAMFAPVINIFTTVGGAISGIFGSMAKALTQAVKNLLFETTASVFLFGMTSIATGSIMSAAVSNMGYIFAGTVLAVLGTVVMAYAPGGVILAPVVMGLGWTLVILGGMVGIYGVLPGLAMYIAGGMLGLVYIAGMWYVIQIARGGPA